MKTCCDTEYGALTELNQWNKDVVYVIGIMARRNAYFKEWDVVDIVGEFGAKHNIFVRDILLQAAKEGIIRDTGHRDRLWDGTERVIWIGATAKEA